MDVEGGLGDMDINCEELAGDRAPEAADSITPDEMKHCQIKKKLGVPELDPDALPSSLLNKYLIFSCIVARMLTVSIPPNPIVIKYLIVSYHAKPYSTILHFERKQIEHDVIQ